jgi:hypothetical protein
MISGDFVLLFAAALLGLGGGVGYLSWLLLRKLKK